METINHEPCHVHNNAAASAATCQSHSYTCVLRPTLRATSSSVTVTCSLLLRLCAAARVCVRVRVCLCVCACVCLSLIHI